MSTKIDRRHARDHGREKSGWRVFLKPGWVMAVLAIIAFSYAAFSFLAPWQLNKDEDILQRNEQIEASFDSDPVPYREVFDDAGAVTPDEEWSRVMLTGNYLPQSEVLLRLRPVDKTPVYQALTPFETNAGDTVLVNRGFEMIPGAEMPEIDSAPTSEVTIVGHARLNEVRPTNPPMTDQGRLQVYGISTDQISETVDLDLANSYLQLSEGEPGVVNHMPVPQLDRGSHLSYGLQWLAFGVMAPLGLGYFIWSEVRERRRVRREAEELSSGPASHPENDLHPVDGQGGEIPGDDPSVTAVAVAPTGSSPAETAVANETAAAPQHGHRSRTVRSRYGGQHRDHWSRRHKKNEERF